MDKYLEKLCGDLELRDLQPTTRQHYQHVLREFLRFVRHDERCFTADDARTYLLRLRGRGRSPATINTHHAALNFWFTWTLGRPEVMASVPRAKVRRLENLPNVPSMFEIARIFEATTQPFYRTLFQTVYATGMRSREVRNLCVQHIESQRGLIRVPAEHAKGRKPRHVPLSDRLLQLLRAHWRRHALPGPFLFPARVWVGYFAPQPIPDAPWKDHAVSNTSANEALRKSQVAARIDKRITLHLLRHAFATHLLEQGVGIRRLQVLLGHASIRSTQIYTHVRTDLLKSVPSPLDLLPT